MSPIIIKATEAKTRFGKYLKTAQRGKPVIIQKQNDDNDVIMITVEQFEDLMEIFKENNDKNLQDQIQNGYKEYQSGKCKEGIKKLVDILTETKKKELLK